MTSTLCLKNVNKDLKIIKFLVLHSTAVMQNSLEHFIPPLKRDFHHLPKISPSSLRALPTEALSALFIS